MIDIHTHILPGVDDGAADMEEALEMLHMAENSGVTELIVTPHCNVPGSFKNYFGEWYVDRYRGLLEAAGRAGLRIKILPGMEVYATYDLPQLLAEEKIMTLCQTHYLLTEFDFGEDPVFADRMLDRLREMDVWPVVAHAERYRFVQDFPEIVYDWRKKGYAVQVNKGSFLGKFGRSARHTAYRLMDHNLVSAVASDAHSPVRRTTVLTDAWEALSEDYPVEYLEMVFRKNPARIIRGRPVDSLPPVPF